jgi:hypothetical protein
MGPVPRRRRRIATETDWMRQLMERSRFPSRRRPFFVLPIAPGALDSLASETRLW